MDPNNAPSTEPSGTPPEGAPANPAPEGAPSPGERTFTQEEVNKLVGKAREEGRRSAQKQNAPEPKPDPQPAPQPAPSNGRKMVSQADLRFRDLLEVHEIRGGDREKLTRIYNAERPSDVDSWFGEARDTFAPKPKDPPKASEPGPAALTPPAPTNPGPGGSPRAPSNDGDQPDGLVDLWSMTKEQVREMGMEKIRAEFERHQRAIHQRRGYVPVPRVLRNAQKR